MTIIVRHDCVKYGSGTPGSALDCPPCWEALQQRAFPEGPDLPRLIVRNSRKTISREVVENDLAIQDPGAFHLTTVAMRPFKTQPGGMWMTTCTCGWSRSGRYARDEGETAAFRLAQMRGAEHEDNPDKRCAYCGHPERERACTFCQHGSRQ